MMSPVWGGRPSAPDQIGPVRAAVAVTARAAEEPTTICVRCLDVAMNGPEQPPRTVRATREMAASAERIFEFIADPAQQPHWDGNENLKDAAPGQRVRAVGDVFRMRLTTDSIRENHVVDFVEGRRIAWRPAEVGKAPPGHVWGWELEPLGPSRTLVTHTYDWTDLADETRLPRARSTTTEKLQASLDRLAALAERA